MAHETDMVVVFYDVVQLLGRMLCLLTGLIIQNVSLKVYNFFKLELKQFV